MRASILTMKIRHLIPLVLVLVGCSNATVQHPASLTAEQARVIARDLANEKANALYGTRPFWDGASSRFVEGRWHWNDRRGCGGGDMEATVILAVDGSAQSVNVMLLDSRALF